GRQAGDRPRVASARLSLVLDLEEPTAHRPPARAVRHSRSDSRVVDRESPLGRASGPWRASEAGDLGESVDRGEVHAAASTSTIANVADLPDEPREPDHGRGPLRRADDHVPLAL